MYICTNIQIISCLGTNHTIQGFIIKDRKTSFVFTGYYVKEKEWDKVEKRVRKSHPNSTRLNNLLLKKVAEVNKIKRVGKNASFFDLAKQRIEAYKKKGTFSVSKKLKG